ncbi:unnamed protein product [Cylindrotheca closterium]|uniref:Uncharacterized protein n=1 Tax=Cylindrotheca closterium TaxID=2856 RepID=A0AAD2G5G0_9STRA|nr:unnamed protein product [Cylindrotheca closterium]
MDKYLNSLRNEHKKRVRFHIVEDNARLHSSIEVDRWASTDHRTPIRRHHSQPIMRKRSDTECKATARWNSEASTSSTAPLKAPKRLLSSGGDRWRVGRNNSDSIIHSPPKRRYSPNSPMLMMASLKVDKVFPSSPPLKTNDVILDQALNDLKTDVDLLQDDSTNTETEIGSWNLDENEESASLVQKRQVSSPQQSQQEQRQQHNEESNPTILKSLFGLLDLMLLWSFWNVISMFIGNIISRCSKDDRSPGLMSEDKRVLAKMEQGEAIPLTMQHQPHNSPSKSR